MPDRTDPEALFRANLPLIDRLVAAMVRRQGLRDEEGADCASWIKLRLIEDDYALLRKFRGESALSTYLTVVVAMLCRDYHVRRWGRWRPSAAARRLGAVAIRLETLVHRRGYALREAAQILRSGGHTALSDGELARLLSELPARQPLRPVEVGADSLDSAQQLTYGASPLDEQVAVEDRRRIDDALARALDTLRPEDRLVLQMRFWDGLSVADVSRALGVPQKPLYRQIERALLQLRRSLEGAGVSRAEVLALWTSP